MEEVQEDKKLESPPSKKRDWGKLIEYFAYPFSAFMFWRDFNDGVRGESYHFFKRQGHFDKEVAENRVKNADIIRKADAGEAINVRDAILEGRKEYTETLNKRFAWWNYRTVLDHYKTLAPAH